METSATTSPPEMASTAISAAAILRINIERFRCIKTLSWRPALGVNLLIGAGDIGKTSILESVGLLFSPTNNTNISDADYYLRDVASGFSIEAIVQFPANIGINTQFKESWPWVWDGDAAVVPGLDGDGAPRSSQPVYRVRLRGTADLDLSYEIVQPNGNVDTFGVGLRRAVGLVRLSGDDRNDRDLRLVQGSALDRLLGDKTLRSRLASRVSTFDVKGELGKGATDALAELDATFAQQALPTGLDLAVTGAQGFSIGALIGLTAKVDAVPLPLASWGAGTRRLAALAIASENQRENPITIVDELERGLEPYRQRALMRTLQAGASQAFVTTHSAPVISAVTTARVWHVNSTRGIGPFERAKIARQLSKEPEAFLARLPIIAEGVTEVGFLAVLLQKALFTSIEQPMSIEQHGVFLSDGGGNENVLDLLEAMTEAGFACGGFADNEGNNPTRWRRVGDQLGNRLFRWKSGCLEQNIIAALPVANLEEFVTDPDGENTGERLRTLAFRLGSSEKDFATLAAATTNLKQFVIEAALGKVPEAKKDASKEEKKRYSRHAQLWFKTLAGGRELATKTMQLGVWSKIKIDLMPFLNAIRTALSLAPIEDIH